MTAVEEVDIVVHVNDDSEPSAFSNAKGMIKCELLLPANVRNDDGVKESAIIYNQFPLSFVNPVGIEYEMKQDIQDDGKLKQFKYILNLIYSIKYDIGTGKLKITFDETSPLIDGVDAIIQWRQTNLDVAMKYAMEKQQENQPTETTIDKRPIDKEGTARILNDLIEWLQSDHEEARIAFDGRNLRNIRVFIDGPIDSAYEGGTFELDVRLPKRYPKEPPKVVFKTKIFHLNITDEGRVFLDTLISKWNGKHTLLDAIDSIIEMLEDGKENKDHPANDTAALFYNESVDKYRREAIRQTKQYAIQNTDDHMKTDSEANIRLVCESLYFGV